MVACIKISHERAPGSAKTPERGQRRALRAKHRSIYRLRLDGGQLAPSADELAGLKGLLEGLHRDSSSEVA